MASNPDVLQKAQTELDAVVGPHRLPEFSDMKALPYVCALIKELLRWRVVVPLGVPHRALEDDEYRGYFIPKGSLVIANIWWVLNNGVSLKALSKLYGIHVRAIARDPKVFPSPDVFMPERFLKDGQLNPDVRDPASFSFGYGRR